MPTTSATTMPSTVQRETLFGHPVGLYTLFFAEMWERFSFYGMRALLVLYMTKGFLGYGDELANGVYSAYIAFVYATGFIGGMFADRLLGTRRSIILGGLLMAAGHLTMTIPRTNAFYIALGLLITGNGFFKPNISTTVGRLYPPGSPKKDGGFTIFYIGINLGAALAPLICAYVGDHYGREYGFGLATIGMLIGLAVFVMPVRITQLLILSGALATFVAMLFWQDSAIGLAINLFTGLALVVAGVIAFVALGRGGLPAGAGAPPDPALLNRRFGPFTYDILVYFGAILSVPVFALLLQGSSIASYILFGSGFVALVYMIFEACRRSKVERERMFVILVLMFFSIVFWAAFEQAGSSMQFFEDRNLDRVVEASRVTEKEVGTQIKLRVERETNDVDLKQLPLLTQEQVGRANDNVTMNEKIAEAIRLGNTQKPDEKKLSADKLDDFIKRTTSSNKLLLTGLDALRDAMSLKDVPASLRTIDWNVTASNVGMGIGGSEIASPTFQAANPIYIMIFGLVFTALWTTMASRGIEPSIPVKFSLALLQLGLGFGVMWYGAQYAADERGMVALPWLLVGIMLHTTGELCTSPIGLSMVSNLAPRLVVSTVMGAWWLGMAIANKFSGVIANMMRLEESEGGGQQVIPLPIDTVHTYGHVFGQIAVAAFIAALICLLLTPLLNKWMHAEAEPEH